jgi:hypothetical protein
MGHLPITVHDRDELHIGSRLSKGGCHFTVLHCDTPLLSLRAVSSQQNLARSLSRLSLTSVLPYLRPKALRMVGKVTWTQNAILRSEIVIALRKKTKNHNSNW